VNEVRAMQEKWNLLDDYVDGQRFRYVQSLLEIQVKEAAWWRDACLLYF